MIKQMLYVNMKIVQFEKLEKEILDQVQIMVKTGDGKIVRWRIYKFKEDFIKISQKFKKMRTAFIKLFYRIVEQYEGNLIAYYIINKTTKL